MFWASARGTWASTSTSAPRPTWNATSVVCAGPWARARPRPATCSTSSRGIGSDAQGETRMIVGYANSVTIGPEFFGKSFNDYRDKFWAFAREILQNCIDCGSRQIDISIQEMPDDNTTFVTVRNDGVPMTEDILVNKLLSLGSSGKDFQGAVGGFGKAKEILYFAHQSYAIVAGAGRVAGSGAGYDIAQAGFIEGTRSSVTWKGCLSDE